MEDITKMNNSNSGGSDGGAKGIVAKYIRLSAIGVALAAASIKTVAAPMLEEVIVTAQKRAENMQDVPVAVSALSADALADIGFRDVADLEAQIPSLVVSLTNDPMGTALRIRGIGNEGNIPTFESATALFIDGAFRSRAGLGLGDLVDVQSIEVLKGPQSTLHGKNASAGLIAITTKGPTQNLEAMLEYTSGSESLRQIRAYVSGPLTDRVSGRFSFQDTRRDHLIENLSGLDADNQNGYAVRGQLRFELSEYLTSRLIVGLVDRDMDTQFGDVENSELHERIILEAGGTVKNNTPNDRIVDYDRNLNYKQDANDIILNVEYQKDNFTFTSISSYDDYVADALYDSVEQISLSIASFNDYQKGRSLSQEFRFEYNPTDNLFWLNGIFAYKNEFIRGKDDRPEFTTDEDIMDYGGAVLAAAVSGGSTVIGLPSPILGSPGDAGHYDIKQNSTALGVFSKVDYYVGEAFQLSAGVRYSWEEKTADLRQFNTTATGCEGFEDNIICAVSPNGEDYADKLDWSAVTGKFNLSYFPSDAVMMYASYSTGFKAGGFSLQYGSVEPATRPFDKEQVANVELGIKSEFWNNRARVNAALFHSVYEDYQSASFVGLVFVVNNAKEVVSDGLEVDSTFVLTENLTATLNMAYIDGRFEEYDGGQCYYGRESDAQFGQCTLDGQSLFQTPKRSASLGLAYNKPIFKGDFYSRIDVRSVSEANNSAELDPRHVQDGFTTTNLRIGWRNSVADISFWAKNITGRVYFTARAPGNIAGAVDKATNSPEGTYQSFSGQPRTLGATLRMYY